MPQHPCHYQQSKIDIADAFNKFMRILSIASAVTAFIVTSLSLPCHADLPRPEHPRPDFQRESWLNLNGEWQFEVDSKAEGEQSGWMSSHDLTQRIVIQIGRAHV